MAAVNHRRIDAACEPLLGPHYGVMHHSPQHGGVVSLWIQSLTDGRVQVDAVYPNDGYRVLFKERFEESADAKAFFLEQHAELFNL